MRLATIAAVLLALFPAAASARTLDFSDVRRIVSLSSPQISPDGTRIAFLRGHADFAKDRSQSDLMVIDVKSRRMRQLTHDRRGLGSPRWSPDGSRIAFLAPIATEGSSEPQEQVFVLRMDGGEAQQITKTPQGVDGFAWSPDGRALAFISPDPNPYKKQIEQHLDAFEVGDNDYLHTAAAIPSHLWVISSSGGGKAKRLTGGSWSLGTVDPSITSELSWSANGKQIAYVHFPTPLIGDALGAVVEIVDARSGRRERLTGTSGLEGAPEFAPAGDTIAYSRNAGGDDTNGNAI